MKLLTFQIPGEPTGKGRPRFRNAGKFVQTYTPAKTRSYETLVQTCFSGQCGRDAEGYFEAGEPVYVTVYAYYGIPKSAPKKRREAMLAGEEQPTKKPDLDNVLKALLDPLIGLAFSDDSQVVGMDAIKLYSEEPHVTVILSDSPYQGGEEQRA